MSNWLSGLSEAAIAIGMFVMMLLAAGAGRLTSRLQQQWRPSKEEETDASVAQEGYLLGGTLATLGLLLAFTFGMVLNRYEARRELVTKEANAIGTAYLRAQLLDEPDRSRLSRLLMAYTANRIGLATTRGDGGPYLSKNDELLTDIWTATRAARESALKQGITTALLLSVNEVIDLDTERKLAWDLRVPAEILTLLAVYLAVTAAVVGHQVDGPRGNRAALVLFALISFSIATITDINRPRSGSHRESQKPMIMVLHSMRAQPPTTFDRYDNPAKSGGGAPT